MLAGSCRLVGPPDNDQLEPAPCARVTGLSESPGSANGADQLPLAHFQSAGKLLVPGDLVDLLSVAGESAETSLLGARPGTERWGDSRILLLPVCPRAKRALSRRCCGPLSYSRSASRSWRDAAAPRVPRRAAARRAAGQGLSARSASHKRLR